MSNDYMIAERVLDDKNFIDGIRILILPVSSLMLYLPSVTFNIVSAEIFPWAFLFFLFYATRISRRFAYLWLVLSFFLLLSLFVNREGVVYEGLRSLFAYLNPLAIFFLVLNGKYSFYIFQCRVVKKVFVFMIVLGAIQSTELLYFANDLVGLLMQRGAMTDLGSFGGRGVSLLSSEPARASYEMVFMFLLVRNLYVVEKYYYVVDIMFAVYVLFVLSSGTGVLLFLVYMFLFYSKKVFGVICLMAVMIMPLYSDIFDARSFRLMALVFNSADIGELYLLFINQSGFRFISVIAAFAYSLLNPFGGGIGNWRASSINALELTGLSPNEISYFAFMGEGGWLSIRPASYFASLFLDIGFVGGAVFLIIFIPIIWRYWAMYSSSRPVIYMFVFYLFFLGSVGDPVPWIITALLLVRAKTKEDVLFCGARCV